MLRSRLLVLQVLAILAFLPLVARLAWLQLNPAEYEASRRDSEHTRLRYTAPRRGQILARDGTVLAGNRPSFQLSFAPHELHPRAEPLRVLHEVLGERPGFPSLAELEAHLLELGEAALREPRPADATEADRDWVLLLQGLDGPTARLLNRRWRACPGVLNPGTLKASKPQDATTYEVWFHLERALRLERTLGNLAALLRREVPGATLGLEGLLAAVRARFDKVDERVGRELESLDKKAELARQAPLAGPERVAEIRRRRQAHLGGARFELAREVPASVVTAIEYFPEVYAGLRCADIVHREYPLGEATGALVGWLTALAGDESRLQRVRQAGGLIDEFKDLKEVCFRSQRPGALRRADFFGATGLEARYDETLRGLYGRSKVSVSREGELLALVEEIPLEHGQDLTTTIDARLQLLLYRALEQRIEPAAPPGSGTAGSAVVMDLETGGLLASVGFPGVDAGRWREPGYEAELKRLWEPRTLSYLADRPSFVALFPGSVFKIIVAAAALEGEDPYDLPGSPDVQFPCQHFFEPIPELECDANPGHGDVDLVEALQVSCNVYFYSLAHQRLSPFTIDAWARRLGYGAPSGIDLPRHRWESGVLPVLETPRLQVRELLRGGAAACHFAIGQNPVKATPLQVLRSIAAVALGTYVPRPHLVRPQPAERLEVKNPRTLAAIRDGLWRVAHRPGGTAYKEELGLRGYNVALKTGTAELKEDLPIHNGWLVGYAPFESPRIAFVVVIEETNVHGGEACAPIVRQLLEHFAAEDPAAYRRVAGGSP